MTKKAGLVSLVICLLMALVWPGFSRAQNELTVVESSAQVVFPLAISFGLTAERC